MKELILTSRLSVTHPYLDRRIETEYWHHRSPWMEDMLRASVSALGHMLGSHYDVRILTSTGDGGREAFAANLIAPGDVAWVSPEGSFAPVLRRLGADVRTVTGTRLPEAAPTAVFLDHVREDGSVTDLPRLVRRIRGAHPGALVVVDLSWSFGADDIDFSALECDGYLIVPERALGSIPGAAVIALRESLRKRIVQTRARMRTIPYSFDLLKYDQAWGKTTTPYSPSISSIVGLATTLELIAANGGLPAHAKRHGAYAKTFRAGLRARGARPLAGQRTNAFTVADLPASIRARTVVSALQKAGIGIEEFPARANAIRVGHMGYLTDADIERFFSALSPLLPGATPSLRLKPLSTPPAFDPKIRALCTVSPEEFVEEAKRMAERTTKNCAYREKIVSSARRAFATHRRYDLYGCFTTRTLGFIGAGHTVRASVAILQRAGVSDIIVFSPSLARKKKRGETGGDADDHKTLAYWERRGVTVAGSAHEVFLHAHTVVLLPTYYTKRALALLGKPKEYLNENMVDAPLLREIRERGKMDLLINASAREGLIDRAALSAELGRGWLRYVADELPPVDDPVLRQENANLTGHVGGSPKLTRARIAENTHALLRQVIAEFSARRARRAKSSYVVNVLNAHRRPRGGWRSERVRSAEVRVLLADVFDTATLNFDALERACGVRIRVKDISRGPRSEAALRSALRTFKPNLLMIRTGTIITRSIAQALASLPGCTAVIRPGVGIDNVYDGFETLSAAGIKVINEPYGNAFSVGEMTLHLVANGVQKTLLAPGPTQFKPEVFAVMSAYTYPASPSYRAAYRETVRRLRPWMDLGRDPLVLTTPSTGFMEAAITNLTAEGDRGFVVAHGKFGNRFIEIANATGRAVDALRVDDAEWGRVFSPADIARALREDARRIRKTGGTPYAFLCFQQNETSSGVAYRQDHLRAIVKAARAYNPDILILMDGVSGVGAHALEFRSLDIDAIIIGAQKALGVSSGITYAAVSRRAIARLLSFAGYRGTLARLAKDPRREQYLEAFETRQRTWYLSILRLLVEEESPREVPGIFHLLSTRASLRLMAAEGGKNAVVARHHRLAEYCRAEVKRLSLETLSHPPYQSDSVTPALTPAPQDATKLREELLNRYGFSVAGAQSDYWKSRLVRIGHVGYVTMSDVVRCMRAIRILLR